MRRGTVWGQLMKADDKNGDKMLSHVIKVRQTLRRWSKWQPPPPGTSKTAERLLTLEDLEGKAERASAS